MFTYKLSEICKQKTMYCTYFVKVWMKINKMFKLLSHIKKK